MQNLRYASTARAHPAQAIGSRLLDVAAGRRRILASRADRALAATSRSAANGKHRRQA
jgi:hypothetical protein